MERVSVKPACYLLLFMAALSLLPSSLVAQTSVGPNNKNQMFKTGQLCKSHSDCKANSIYPNSFCSMNNISGSEIGHCVGFGSNPALPSLKKHKKQKKHKKSKPKPNYCGKCETDEDCHRCDKTLACATVVFPHFCI